MPCSYYIWFKVPKKVCNFVNPPLSLLRIWKMLKVKQKKFSCLLVELHPEGSAIHGANPSSLFLLLVFLLLLLLSPDINFIQEKLERIVGVHGWVTCTETACHRCRNSSKNLIPVILFLFLKNNLKKLNTQLQLVILGVSLFISEACFWNWI